MCLLGYNKVRNSYVLFPNYPSKQEVMDSCRFDEMYQTVHQATCRCFEIDELCKFVMDEMYKIGRFIANLNINAPESIVPVVRAKTSC